MMKTLTEVHGITFRDASLIPIWEKVHARERIAPADGVALFGSDDLSAIGRMADHAARARSGDKVYFVINTHINPTNVCVLNCKFCDYVSDRNDTGAWEMSVEEILSHITPEMTEVHIVGGHHPDWTFEYHEGYIRAIREAFPAIQIKAFTAAEIDYFAKRWKIDAGEILDRLIAAGLNSMPGGGAEIFSTRVAKELRYAGKAQAARWLEIHAMAHERGIPSNATMLYGHIETLEERVEHLRLLREQQDASGGFLAFIPLEYQVSEERLVSRHASALDDLKTVAVSRLMLDNFDHVKAYWIMLQEDTAGIALNFGADDIDGTIVTERIAHAADARSPVGNTRQKLVRLIRDAGKVPVERDALYNELRVYTEAEALEVAASDYAPIQRSRVSPRAGEPLAQNAGDERAAQS
jgi:aminodeoxyfutalosine synthase